MHLCNYLMLKQLWYFTYMNPFYKFHLYLRQPSTLYPNNHVPPPQLFSCKEGQYPFLCCSISLFFISFITSTRLSPLHCYLLPCYCRLFSSLSYIARVLKIQFTRTYATVCAHAEKSKRESE